MRQVIYGAVPSEKSLAVRQLAEAEREIAQARKPAERLAAEARMLGLCAKWGDRRDVKLLYRRVRHILTERILPLAAANEAAAWQQLAYYEQRIIGNAMAAHLYALHAWQIAQAAGDTTLLALITLQFPTLNVDAA